MTRPNLSRVTVGLVTKHAITIIVILLLAFIPFYRISETNRLYDTGMDSLISKIQYLDDDLNNKLFKKSFTQAINTLHLLAGLEITVSENIEPNQIFYFLVEYPFLHLSQIFHLTLPVFQRNSVTVQSYLQTKDPLDLPELPPPKL